jgi:type IV secretion system protein VirB9
VKRIALLMILVLGFSEPTLALQQPSPGQRDARVRTVTYDPANVVKVNGVIRASTQVVFADDEEVAHVAIGDSVAWEVAPAG